MAATAANPGEQRGAVRAEGGVRPWGGLGAGEAFPGGRWVGGRSGAEGRLAAPVGGGEGTGRGLGVCEGGWGGSA